MAFNKKLNFWEEYTPLLMGVWLYNWHSSVRQYWLDAERSHQFKSSSETHFLAQNRIGQKSPGEDFNTTA